MEMIWDDEKFCFWLYLFRSDFIAFLTFDSSGKIFLDDYNKDAWWSICQSFQEEEWSLWTETFDLFKWLTLGFLKIICFLVSECFWAVIDFKICSRSIFSGLISFWVIFSTDLLDLMEAIDAVWLFLTYQSFSNYFTDFEDCTQKCCFERNFFKPTDSLF